VKTAAAIRHVHFEDLGAYESVLTGAGYAIRYHDAGIDDLQSPQLANCELLAVLGGPIGAYEEDKYPFLKDEIAVIEKRLNFGRPAMGICLGAQLFCAGAGVPRSRRTGQGDRLGAYYAYFRREAQPAEVPGRRSGASLVWRYF
jgi:GMP synthase-like glutamine amidotransferase